MPFLNYEYSALDNIEIAKEDIFDFSVEIEGLKYVGRINKRIRSDHLYVVFNGAVDRQKYEIPMFSRWNWHPLFRAPILSMFDPSLYLNEDLRIGWSVGPSDRDVPGTMAKLISVVTDRLEISPERTICYGSSSGGFAAITVAARMEFGKFIAYNPQTDILKYYKNHVLDFSNVFNASLTPEENALKFPEKWSAIEAVRLANNRNVNMKGVIVQNTVDEFHYENHYLPFCDAFDLPPEGGSSVDGKLMSQLYENEKGHGPESPDIAKNVVEKFVPKLLGQ